MIWFSYMAIPLLLAYFLRMKAKQQYNRVIWLFVAFIFGCGMTHFMGVVVFYNPLYRLDGLLKLFTGVISLATVVALVWFVPQALNKEVPEPLIQAANSVNNRLRLYYLLIGALVLMVGADIWGLTGINGIKDSAHWRAHTYETMQRLEAMYKLLVLAESDERGFIITGDEYYHANMLKTQQRLWRQMEDLKGFVSHTQAQRVGKIHVLVQRRIEQLNETALVSRQGGAEVAARLIRSRTNDPLMKSIFAIQAEINEEEDRLLQVRTAVLNADIRNIIIVNLLASIIGVGVVGMVFLIVLRQTNALEKASTEIERSRRLFFNLFHHMPDAVLIVDQTGNIKDANELTSKLFGYSHDELLGRPVELLLPNRSTQHRLTYFPEARHIGGNADLWASRKDKSEFAVEVTLNPVSSPDELLVIAVIRDITERKNNQAKLEAANKELSQFAYIASHDLKAPLRAISNLSEWIVEDLGESATKETKEHVRLMKQRITNMNALIEGVLDYSRVGRVHVEKKDVDLNVVVQTVLSGLDTKKFKFDIAKLPTVRGNPTVITQLFGNLLGNAIKHHNREDGNVLVTWQDQGPCYQFGIIDDGPGIAKEFHGKLFVMFQKLTTSPDPNSTGIGLALCKKIVEEVGGRIWVDTDAGKGAKFFFTWPKYLK